MFARAPVAMGKMCKVCEWSLHISIDKKVVISFTY